MSDSVSSASDHPVDKQASKDEKDKSKTPELLANRKFSVDKKNYSVSAKKGEQNRFVQIMQILGGFRKGKINISVPTAKKVLASLDEAQSIDEKDYPKILARFPSPNLDCFVELKKSEKDGAFLRISQRKNIRSINKSVVIATEGIAELKKSLSEVLNEIGDIEGEEEEKEVKFAKEEQKVTGNAEKKKKEKVAKPEKNVSDTLVSKEMKDERGKTIFFDCKSNKFGDYLRINEVRQSTRQRASITISMDSLKLFSETLGQLLDEHRKLQVKNGGDSHNQVKQEPAVTEANPELAK